MHYVGLKTLQPEHKALFVSVITIVSASVEFFMTQVADHVRIRLISQLSKGISKVLQKLLKYFNGTAILTSFVLPAAEFVLLILP